MIKSTLSNRHFTFSSPYGKATLERYEYYLTSTTKQCCIEDYCFYLTQLITEWAVDKFSVVHMSRVNEVLHFNSLEAAIKAIEDYWDARA